eukprot:gene2853-5611_t
MKTDREDSKLLSGGNSMYKGRHYMSVSAFQSLSQEVTSHRNAVQIGRSASVGDVIIPDAEVKQQSRKTLYGTLPFIATFGMQQKESSIYDLLSSIRLRSYESLTGFESEAARSPALIAEEIDELVITLPLIIAILAAITLQFLIGYNISICNGSANLIFPNHTLPQWSFAVASLPIGAPFGALLGGYLSNKTGRKLTILISSLFFLVGSIISALSPNIYWFIYGRLFTGLATGIATIVVPLYLGEIAPPTLRGTLGTLSLFIQAIGILISIAIVFPLRSRSNSNSTTELWRYLYILPIFLCCLQLLLSPLLLESPRWLLNQNELSKHGRYVIKQLRGFRTEEDIDNEIRNFIYASNKHKTNRNSAHSVEAMWDLLSYRDTDPLNSFPLESSLALAIMNILAIYVVLKLVSISERRTLLLTSSIGMCSSLIIVTITLQGYLPQICILLGFLSCVMFFELGLGPIPRLLVAEIFESKYVSTAMSIVSLTIWSSNIILSLSFLYIRESLGNFMFVPFITVLIVTFMTIFLYLPETYGRTIDEVQKLLSLNSEDFENIVVEAVGVEDYRYSNDYIMKTDSEYWR